LCALKSVLPSPITALIWLPNLNSNTDEHVQYHQVAICYLFPNFTPIGLACFCWCCLYVFYARDTPGEMTGIKPIEKKYIEMSLGVYGQSIEERNRKRVSTRSYV